MSAADAGAVESDAMTAAPTSRSLSMGKVSVSEPARYIANQA